jgi:hypothetical protein
MGWNLDARYLEKLNGFNGNCKTVGQQIEPSSKLRMASA